VHVLGVLVLSLCFRADSGSPAVSLFADPSLRPHNLAPSAPSPSARTPPPCRAVGLDRSLLISSPAMAAAFPASMLATARAVVGFGIGGALGHAHPLDQRLLLVNRDLIISGWISLKARKPWRFPP